LNMLNQGKFNQNAMDVMNQQLDMQKSAYEQDMANQEKTQNLNF